MLAIKQLADYWYRKSSITYLLLPLSWLYRLVVCVRYQAYRLGVLPVYHSPRTVIIVGNISVGGSGKTPLVIWLANFLKAQGYRPGIVSRGYGGKAAHYPQHVSADSDPYLVGDEPVLLARRTSCPVVIDPRRVRAVQALPAECDIVIADDGLQHYALGRTIEIVVVDAARGFGNGYCLPAGPLREPVPRLCRADLVVENMTAAPHADALHLDCAGQAPAAKPQVFAMDLVAQGICSVHASPGKIGTLAEINTEVVHAVAAIGHPARFFNQLRRQGLQIIEHAFPDHYNFCPEDINFSTGAVVMTEKDAVKCQRFAQSHHWYVPVDAVLQEGFGERVLNLLERASHG